MVHKRRFLRLVQPRIQLRLMLASGSLVATGLLLQYLLILMLVTRLAETLPGDGAWLVEQLGGALLTALLASFLLLVPLVGLVGILASQRWAGPLYRFERFLEELQRGERPADIRLRKGDELTGFCAKLNQATAPLRRHPTAEAPIAPPSVTESKAA